MGSIVRAGKKLLTFILLHAFPPKNFRYWVQSRGLTYFSDVCLRYLPLLCKIRHPVYPVYCIPCMCMVWIQCTCDNAHRGDNSPPRPRPSSSAPPQPRPCTQCCQSTPVHPQWRASTPSLADVGSYFCPSRHFYWDLEAPAPSLLYLEQARPCLPSPLGRAPPHHKGWEGWETRTRPQSNMQSIKCPILHFIFIAPRIKFQETYYGWFNSNIIYTKGWINIFLRNKAKITGSLSTSHLGYASLQPLPHYSRVVKCSFEIQSFN